MRLLILAIFICIPRLEAAKPPAKHLYPILLDWFQGRADSAYLITEFSHPGVAENMKNAFQVRRAREFWYQKNTDSFKLGHFNWLPVNDFLGRFQTIRGFYRAGIDMVEQTIGGYTVHIHPTGHDSIRFTILDIKSRNSLFLHIPFIGNKSYDGSKKRQKRMTDTHWVIQWTEPVKAFLFYQRKQNLVTYRHRKYSGHNF